MSSSLKISNIVPQDPSSFILAEWCTQLPSSPSRASISFVVKSLPLQGFLVLPWPVTANGGVKSRIKSLTLTDLPSRRMEDERSVLFGFRV